MADTSSPVPTDTLVPSVDSAFFPNRSGIEPTLWDQYRPYQLLIVEFDGTNYVPTGYQFTLPISPQELSIDMPVASNILATQTGVTIQHGGAPFRNISLQGTTGINPHKNTGNRVVPSNSIYGGVATNGALASQALSKVTATGASTAYPANVNLGLTTSKDDPNGIPMEGTGYVQMRLMERFMEAYVGLKVGNSIAQGYPNKIVGKNPASLRMALAIWKDQAVYLVEPIQFTKRRNAANPMEYMFTLTLRAWKRIELSTPNFNPTVYQAVTRNPSTLSSLLNRFRAAGEFLKANQAALAAAAMDPVHLCEDTLRETTFFLKQASGDKVSSLDMPATIKNDCANSIIKDWNILRSQFSGDVSGDLDKALREGRPLTADQKAELLDTIGDKIAPEMLRLSSVTRKQIIAEKSRIEAFGRKDFEKARDVVLQAAADFADKVGAGDTTYSTTYDRPLPTSTRTPSDLDFDVLFSLNETVMILSHLAASSKIDPITPTSMEYVAGLAERSGIAFRVPRSKFAVPFPYGATLESLALQYLGNANRWHEIATLNGLRAPYVDETGFALPLLANGNVNYVVVGDRTNLFVSQTVWLAANGVNREKRHIVGLESISSTQHIVKLDGDYDLARFTTFGAAQLEAFLPGTVNSQQIVYIPSEQSATDDPETKQVPGVDVFDPLLSVSGIDLLLTPDGDLAITPDGDCRLAYGLANIVQTVRIALSTPRGSLLQHPEFGLSVPVGVSTADVDVQTLLESIKGMFSNDPMFSGVRSASVVKDGSILRLTLDIGIAGTSQFVPITVNLTG